MDIKTKEIVEFGEKGKIDGSVLKFPILYTRDKGEKLRLWQIVVGLTNEEITADRSDTDGKWLKKITWIPVVEDYIARGDLPEDAIGVYYTRSGQENGAVKITKPTYVHEGTNIGKKNYTTAFTAAIRKVMTDYNKKIKKGATPDKENVKMRGETTTIEELINEYDEETNPHPWRVFPMAFHSVDKETNWKHIKFPAIMQPKYDGTRQLVVAHPDILNGIDNFSRGRENYDIDHIIEILKEPLKSYPGLYVDGELYKEGYGLQDISGSSRRVKDSKSKREKSIQLEYHIFDVFYLDRKMEFSERADLVEELFEKIEEIHPDQDLVIQVPNVEVESRKEAEKVYKKYVDQGLEGAIIRNEDSPYDVGITKEERTYKSLKMKPKEDSEYEIAGYKEGSGKNKGLIIWICYGPDNGKRKKFSVSPNWPEDKRAEVYKLFQEDPELFEKFKGEEAVIQYSILSKDMLPQQPKFLRFRKPELEDLL